MLPEIFKFHEIFQASGNTFYEDVQTYYLYMEQGRIATRI